MTEWDQMYLVLLQAKEEVLRRGGIPKMTDEELLNQVMRIKEKHENGQNYQKTKETPF